MVVLYHHFGTTCRSHLLGSRNYCSTLRNIPEDRRFHLRSGWSLKSCDCYKVSLFYIFIIVLPADGLNEKADTWIANKEELPYPQSCADWVKNVILIHIRKHSWVPHMNIQWATNEEGTSRYGTYHFCFVQWKFQVRNRARIPTILKEGFKWYSSFTQHADIVPQSKAWLPSSTWLFTLPALRGNTVQVLYSVVTWKLNTCINE